MHQSGTGKLIFVTLAARCILFGMCEEFCERDGDEHCAARGSSMIQMKKPVRPVASGNTAPLNNAGYRSVAKLKNPDEMEIFVKRIISHRGLHVLDEGSLKGMVPYYCGKKATQSFKALSEEINKAQHSKKKRWLISTEALDELEKKAKSRNGAESKKARKVLKLLFKNTKTKAFAKGASFPEAILHTASKDIAVGNGRFSEELLTANLDKTKKCLLKGLQDAHQLSVQKYAVVLATREKEEKEKEDKEKKEKEEKEKEEKEKQEKQPSLEDMEKAPEAPSLEDMEKAPEAADESDATAPLIKPPPPSDDMIGSTAMLTASGFKSVTERCCPIEMEIFFTRLLGSRGYEVCSTPHVQGLMHWFTCVPDMDFEYMIQVIEKGNPCKYWSPQGERCPKLSAKCEGTYCR